MSESNTLPAILRQAGLHDQAERVERDVEQRLAEAVRRYGRNLDYCGGDLRAGAVSEEERRLVENMRMLRTGEWSC